MSSNPASSVTLPLIQTLLSLHTTSQISSHLAKSCPAIPNSLLTSCLSYLIKNSITDPQKLFIFANIVLKVHQEAISLAFGVTNVYENLKVDLLKYTVNAPPYSVELFSLNDFKVMSIWICEIYLKHYKMWLYRDGKKEVINVAALPIDDLSKGNLMSGVQVKPLGESLPAEKWVENDKAQQEEQERRKLEEEEKQEQEQQEEVEQEEHQNEESQQEEKKPHHDIPEREEVPDIKNTYIKRQLEEIKNMLLQLSDEKLGSVEDRLKNIETVVQQQEEEAAQKNTKGKKK